MSKLPSQSDLRCAQEYKERDLAAMLMDHEKDDSALLNECATLYNMMFRLNNGYEDREVGDNDDDTLGGGDSYLDTIERVRALWAKAVIAVGEAQAQTLAGFEAKLNVVEEYVEFVDCCDLTRLLVLSVCEDFHKLKGVIAPSLGKASVNVAGI